MATIAKLLARAESLQSTSDTPRLDVEVLLCHVLDCQRSYLFTWPERRLDDDQTALFESLLARRLAGEPVAYITGEQPFWSLTLKVSPATLIPRPETELLVATALERLPESGVRCLDLGTGTGAIALALGCERPRWSILAVDCQPAAVDLARENARRLGIASVEIRHSDWFGQVEGPFDVIVSNPPYVAPGDAHLHRGDLRFEPVSALVAENAGFSDLDHIIASGRDYLSPGGLLMVEHGADQGEALRLRFVACGYSGTETLKDLAGLDRVTLGYRPG